VDLVADIGNTHCHLAAFSGETIVARAAVRGGRSVGEMQVEWDAFAASLKGPVARAALASVNPKVKIPFAKWLRERLSVQALVLGENLRPDIPVSVDAPEEVGADRLVNALWAARRHKGRAVIVVDFGTAVSFDVVSSAGAFVGGAIAPGVGTQARALSERTALLPHITVTRTPAPIGRDTVSCIDSGIFWGTVGLVDLLSEKIELALGEKALVIATGGDAPLIASGSRRIAQVVPDMTLEGVHMALVEASRP
jgi:type III pantothenate kinase